MKNFKASIENFGRRGNAPPRVPRVQIIRRRFGYTSRTSPDACQFHPEYIRDAKKALWDRGISWVHLKIFVYFYQQDVNVRTFTLYNKHAMSKQHPEIMSLISADFASVVIC